MDLNELYHRRGVSLARAERAKCDRSRDAHHNFANAYAERIAGVHRDLAG